MLTKTSATRTTARPMTLAEARRKPLRVPPATWSRRSLLGGRHQCLQAVKPSDDFRKSKERGVLLDTQLLDVVLDVFQRGELLDERRGDPCAHDTQEGDADEHEKRANNAPEARGGVAVPIADSADRCHGPPQRITAGADVRLWVPSLRVENEATSEDEQSGNGGEHFDGGAPLRLPSGAAGRGPEEPDGADEAKRSQERHREHEKVEKVRADEVAPSVGEAKSYEVVRKKHEPDDDVGDAEDEPDAMGEIGEVERQGDDREKHDGCDQERPLRARGPLLRPGLAVCTVRHRRDVRAL